ncbi:MAG: hypothetical protein KDI09_17405 [Halioglobus sp.]|nr:hypothetical protein [Halioglobus sp.]
MPSEDDKLSTTALARKLDIPVQQLFATLRDYGWIRRAGETWALTPKGEFEGGTYRRSQRYGSYIVWPDSITEHPLLAAIESNQRITADGMCRYYPPLNTRQVNRALAELGLQRHTLLGWELTARGRALGGQQESSRNSGALYATWPHDIVDKAVVHRDLSRLSNIQHTPPDDIHEPDLFAASDAVGESLKGFDGHSLQSSLQVCVCNWLYFAQLVHAHRRALPTPEPLYADFYLPQGNVYIDCWESEVPAHELKERLQKRDLYRELDLRNLQIDAADMGQLDEILSSGLLKFDIRV